MTWFYRQNQKRASDFFRNVMACRINLSDKTLKIKIKIAYEVIMAYHLHMLFYFLGTFTEYPFLFILHFCRPDLRQMQDVNTKQKSYIQRIPESAGTNHDSIASQIKEQQQNKITSNHDPESS